MRTGIFTYFLVNPPKLDMSQRFVLERSEHFNKWVSVNNGILKDGAEPAMK